MSQSRGMRVLKGVGIWLPTVVLGLLFIMQGVMKLQPGSPWIGMFERFGYPAGSRLVIGAAELAGGIALFVPAVAGLGALLLAVVMLGAAATHLIMGETLNAGFTLVLAMTLGALAWVRQPTAGWRRGAMNRSVPSRSDEVAS